MKYDRFGSSGHIIPRFFLVCKGCGEKIANQKECSVAERDDGIPVIVVAAVKETIWDFQTLRRGLSAESRLFPLQSTQG